MFKILAQPYGKSASRLISIAEFRYLREHATSFSDLIACLPDAARLRDESSGNEEYLQSSFVTGNFFRMVGVDMELGRAFGDEEDYFGSPRSVAVISDALWRRRYGGDPGVIGRKVDINNRPFTIVGVAARGFVGLSISIRNDLWIPLPAAELLRPSQSIGMFDDPNNPFAGAHLIAGRLAPGRTASGAKAELDSLSRQFRANWNIEAQGLMLTDTTQLGGAPNQKRQQNVLLFALLFAALLVVQLIACANVGNLQLARALTRKQEIGIRMALGASRARVVRQLLTESVILSLAAGVPAVGIARIIPQAVIGTPNSDDWIVVDWRVLAFAGGICVLAALLSGLAPALYGTRTKLAIASTKQPADIRSSRLRSLLLGAQIALTGVLLVGSGLLTRGIVRAIYSDWGFAINDVLVVNLTPPAGTEPANGRILFQSLMREIASSHLGPVGAADVAPLSGDLWLGVRLPGESSHQSRWVNYRPVSKGYFEVLRIPLVSGRWYDERTSSGEVVINETCARLLWPGEQAIGQTFTDNFNVMHVVVGIVKDAHVASLQGIEPLVHTAPAVIRTLPSLLIRDQNGDLAGRIQSLVPRLDPRIGVSITPLVDIEMRISSPPNRV